MGETFCRSCGEMLWHIDAHATGRCKYCGGRVDFCDSCNTYIADGGDGMDKVFNAFVEKVRKEGTQIITGKTITIRIGGKDESKSEI